MFRLDDALKSRTHPSRVVGHRQTEDNIEDNRYIGHRIEDNTSRDIRILLEHVLLTRDKTFMILIKSIFFVLRSVQRN